MLRPQPPQQTHVATMSSDSPLKRVGCWGSDRPRTGGRRKRFPDSNGPAGREGGREGGREAAVYTNTLTSPHMPAVSL